MFWCGEKETKYPSAGEWETPRCAGRITSPPVEHTALGCLRAVSGSGGDCRVLARSKYKGRGDWNYLFVVIDAQSYTLSEFFITHKLKEEGERASKSL